MKVSTFFWDTRSLSASVIGQNLKVICIDGSEPHFGGVAVSVPYKRTSRIGAAVSCLSTLGHQDSLLASKIVKRFSKKLDLTVFVLCGIHYDNLSSHELEELLETVQSL